MTKMGGTLQASAKIEAGRLPGSGFANHLGNEWVTYSGPDVSKIYLTGPRILARRGFLVRLRRE